MKGEPLPLKMAYELERVGPRGSASPNIDVVGYTPSPSLEEMQLAG